MLFHAATLVCGLPSHMRHLHDRRFSFRISTFWFYLNKLVLVIDCAPHHTGKWCRELSLWTRSLVVFIIIISFKSRSNSMSVFLIALHIKIGKWCRELSLWTRSLVETFVFIN